MKESKRFAEELLEEGLVKLEAEREANRLLLKRLALAEETIRFYGNPKNYLPHRDPILTTVFQNRLTGDYEDAANGANTKIAGARARFYLKQHEDLSDSRL